MINTGEAVYRSLARLLEQRIHHGEPGYGPGWVLPPAEALARQMHLGVDTVREAYGLLTQMGLVSRRQGYGVVVRTERERQVVRVPAGVEVSARMPTFAEIDEWGMEPGVPMLVADGGVWPADRYTLHVDDPQSGPGRTK